MVVKVDMTISIGSIAVVLTVLLSAIGLGKLIWFVARRAFQLVEFLIRVILWAARQQGWEVPDWMASQYKRINGNDTASREEKNDVLGPKHDSGQHDASANAKSAGE